MASVYHSGEVAVQERASARGVAERIGRSIGIGIPDRARDFVHAQPMAVLGTIDVRGGVWASLLTGVPGFLRVVDERGLTIDAAPGYGDPLRDNVRRTKDVGILLIDFATRRRMRLNGRMEVDAEGFLSMHTEQVYANCPKYIQARAWRIEPREASPPSVPRFERTKRLTIEQRRWIERSDTFFIASYHPEAFADASHRGGNPGFVRVERGTRLVWDDYPGNSMFQTLGNLWSYPRAGLLFLDFETGDTLQVTGTAKVSWEGTPDEERARTGRSVELEIEEVVHIRRATSLRWRFLTASPFNPA